MRRFTVSYDSLHPDQHAVDQHGNPIPDAERFKGDEGGTVTIDIPSAKIARPTDGARVGANFDMSVAVMHSDPAAFREHFLKDGKKLGLVAISLDNGDYFSYSINGLDYFPRYVGVAPGAHVLQTGVVHPDTLGIIPGSLGPPVNVVVVPEFARQGTVEVSIAVNGEQQTLTVAKSADFALEAQRFCVGLGVESPQCAQHVLGKLNSVL